MKKIASSLPYVLLGFLGLAHHASAQTNAILVPTYQNQSEMPAKIKPEQKLLRLLPTVVLNEKGANTELFKTEMTTWIEKNPTLINQFEKSVTELIQAKKFDQLAEILINMGHSKFVALNTENKGGKHE